ncbi:MAG: M28 family peptidase [bacterium]|nr:M28 family peptidase [bacterium]
MTRVKYLLILLIAAPYLSFSQETASTAGVATTPEAQRILEHVKTLASPEYGGRGVGTDGNKQAALYIEQQLKNVGLQPAAGGSFQQTFPMTIGAKLGANNSVGFDVLVERPGIPLDQTKPTKISWKLGVDWQPYVFSESKTVTGDVVFVGYGLSAPAAKYDDYAGVDVAGKIVVVLRGLPKWAEKNDALKGLASLRTKTTTARDKGATAICFVNERGDSADVLAPFGIDRLGMNSGIVALQVRRTPCARIFSPKGTSLFVAETEIESKRKPMSFALINTTATITVSTELIEGSSTNVAGVIRGSDPALASQYIVVGAHYDHLGMGDENSLHSKRDPIIHPGADDNASGTAGLIELARRLNASPPRRSILFLAFSGEEKGLVGSKYWTTTPTIPFADVAAMINMDMIGRLKDNKLNIQGTGTSSVWPSIITRTKTDLPLVVSSTSDGFGPSDHSSFTAKNVPVLFFFTGLHTDYHRPTDTWDKLNYDGESTVLTYIERVIRDVADSTERPTFASTHGSGAGAKSMSAGFNVTFGVIPDYGDDPQGLRITGVKPGGPAEKAGLAGDDIITKFGATTVKNIYDLTAALGEHKPGDVVQVTILRQGKPSTLNVVLTGK